MRKLSVIIPTLNEQENIRPLVVRLDKALSDANKEYEIIFVDDNSTDKTQETIAKLSKSYPISLHLKKGKRGKAQSLLEGFGYAKYKTVAMIDADLQYPPEAMPKMFSKIGKEIDIVVANRLNQDISFRRKIISRTFAFFFGRFLHGLKHDVQSGLKVFPKEIVERIKLHPSAWTFDLEFLLKAQDAGYKIGSVDISFKERYAGKPKIGLLGASLQIGISALSLRFRKSDIVPFHPKDEETKGKGFHFKGKEFIHHTDLDYRESAFKRLAWNQAGVLLAIALIVFLGLIVDWRSMIIILIALLTLLYFADLLFNLFLVYRSFSKEPEISISSKEINSVGKSQLPKYTIFCPLYREWEVLPQFITAISRLDYPKDKLQVLLLLEEDDKETIQHVGKIELPEYFEVIIVPHSIPKTKPKALNYGLSFATGKYSVIYDAEDIPDPKQLKKAVIAFGKSDDKTVCIQAKLNFYNPHHNILTRAFTAEYSLWFDLVLTGLQSITAPIPLGGTSNHFRVSDLVKLKGWDAFNVTEDCDLGMRLVKHGYKTAIINSITLEEANSNLLNWIRQRTRWVKGYLQTYLVHMRNTDGSHTSWRKIHLGTFQLVVGGKVLSMFINPFMWVLTLSYFLFRSYLGTFIESFYPTPVLYMGAFSLVFGNFLYMYYYMIGCAKRKDYDLIKYVLLVPFYWLFMSVAAWRALYQIITRPHYWDKTVHGYHITHKKAQKQAKNFIGRELVDYKLAISPKEFRAFYSKTRASSASRGFPIFSRGSFLVISMMLANFLNFLFNAFLGRMLPAAEFGLVALINTFWYISNIPLGALGGTINHRTAYLSARFGTKAADIFMSKTRKKSFALALGFSLLWLAVSPILAGFFKVEQTAILLFTPVIALGVVSSINKGYLNGRFRFGAVGFIFIIEALSKLGIAVLLVAFLLHSFAYTAIPFAIIPSLVLSLLIVAKLKGRVPRKSINYLFPRRFFVAAMATGLSTNMFLSMDLILTKHYLSAQLAGEYALLSLVGKIVFFLGSLFQIFIIPFVAQDVGLKKDPNRRFYLLFVGILVLVLVAFSALGPLGYFFAPLLLGSKAVPILPYLTNYTLAISLFTLSSAIVLYHLARKQYLFPVAAIATAGILSLGIIFNHTNIAQITEVLLTISFGYFLLMVGLHLLQRRGKFIFRNLIDLADLLFPLPKPAPLPSGKRILIFNWRDTKHVYAGGAEVYIHELAKRWVKAGHSVTLFCGNDSSCSRNDIIDGVNVIRRGGFYFVYIWAFLYYILKFRGRYDVILDSQNGIPFFTPIYAKERVFCLVHHVHQEVFRRSLSRPLAFIATVLENRVMPYVYKNTKFITVSKSTKIDMVNLEIGKAGIDIVSPGVNLEQLKPGRKSQKPTILYLGRLKEYKSVDILIRSFKDVANKVANARLIIAGEGEEELYLKQLVLKQGLKDIVEFKGRVSEQEKASLMQRAWVFVNPSYMEGFGLATVEANACATPVVASNVAGLRDSVSNPSSGYLVPYGNTSLLAKRLITILQDGKLRKHISSTAVRWARNFSWHKSADKSLKILSS